MPLRIAVLDMQPISPPIGGGRLRLLGLYGGLGRDCEAIYVGSYDWPGPTARRARLADTLTEVTVPLGAAHHAAAERWRALAGDRVVIDVSFPLLAHHSPAFVAATRDAAMAADVVVFSHPWVFPLVSDRLAGKLVVYDAQNVEGVLRAELLGDSQLGRSLARRVALLEGELCRRADLVLACSLEDRAAFNRLYRVPLDCVVPVPNGAFTSVTRPADATTREAARAAEAAGDRPLCLFVGSLYPPNVAAARFVVERLAPGLPDVTFVVAGGVGDALGDLPRPDNVVVTGVVTAERYANLLAAADVAVNPVPSGSGTNVKMLEFMAAGLPIVSTAAGARGIPQDGDAVFLVAEGDEMAAAVRRLTRDRQLALNLGRAARRHAVTRYSWESISERVGHLLRRSSQTRGRSRPFFSVVVATLGRPQRLRALLRRLEMQTWEDFEVVVVDQSPDITALPETALDLAVIRTATPGAARARNTGALCARGAVLAFTDDDCEPMPDWLAKARRYLDHPLAIGVEGRVMGHPGDAGQHWVENRGIEGLGFITANLFLRREAFLRVGGFDESFDAPHFREDSDLAWRCLSLGRIPFGHDVLVYHPPHASERPDDLMERVFAKDALLYRRHPHAYRCLHARERHSSKASYRSGLPRGAAEHGVDVAPLLAPAVAAKALPGGRASLRVTSIPALVAAGSTFYVKLAVTNDGETGWSAYGDDTGGHAVRLSYRWFDGAGRVVVESGIRSLLPYDVEPGETVEVCCRVDAPSSAGVHDLTITLLQENVGWWDQANGTGVRRRVAVVPAGLPARRDTAAELARSPDGCDAAARRGG